MVGLVVVDVEVVREGRRASDHVERWSTAGRKSIQNSVGEERRGEEGGPRRGRCSIGMSKSIPNVKCDPRFC